jgi:hypothetical protein
MSRSARFLEVRLEHLLRAGRRVLRDITWTIRPGPAAARTRELTR